MSRLALLTALALVLSCGAPAAAPSAGPSSLTPTSPSTTAPSASAPPSPSGAATTAPLTSAIPPLFDAHIHYSAPAWEAYDADTIIALLQRAGIARALVSSTPDEGTWRLYDRAPDMVVPFLRPYRGESGPGAWVRDGTTVAYVRSIYRPGVHRGIGEIHLAAGESDLPVVRALIEMAVNERMWLQIHTDARGIDEVMRGPAARTRVLWAHAGQSATPAEIAALVARYSTMWVELAGRTDIAPGGTIDPAWRELFTRYPDRFLVGSDTWINPQWERLEEISAATRAWLAQLPPEISRRIATENADALFPL